MAGVVADEVRDVDYRAKDQKVERSRYCGVLSAKIQFGTLVTCTKVREVGAGSSAGVP